MDITSASIQLIFQIVIKNSFKSEASFSLKKEKSSQIQKVD